METLLTVIIGGGFALAGTILGGRLVWQGENDKTKRDMLIKASSDFEEAFAIVFVQIVHSRLILEARAERNEQRYDSCVESATEHHPEVTRAISLISRLRGYITLAGSDGLAIAHEQLTKGIPDGRIAYLDGDEKSLLPQVEDQARHWSSLGESFRRKLKSDFDRIGSAKAGFLIDLGHLMTKLRS